ncbi:MAG: hypothetical protein K8R23_07670 [Chthoniobacter sp.]|nr:hypothetical protein [Chthoniobacter sp.]
MNSYCRFLLFAAAGALAVLAVRPVPARADGEIAPPFNLKWGEPALRLEEALLGTSARIAERSKTRGGGEVWKVDGLPGIALQRVSFHLRAGKLVEVELQYSKEDWSAATYEEFMQNVRRRIEERHGPGKPITRQRETERGIMKTLVGFRWDSGGGALELYFFAAENAENVFRSVSLHYQSPTSAPAVSDSEPEQDSR